MEYIFATGKSRNTNHLSCLPGTVLPGLDLFGKNAPMGPASMALPSRSAVNTSYKAEILEKFMSQKTN